MKKREMEGKRREKKGKRAKNRVLKSSGDFKVNLQLNIFQVE